VFVHRNVDNLVVHSDLNALTASQDALRHVKSARQQDMQQSTACASCCLRSVGRRQPSRKLLDERRVIDRHHHLCITPPPAGHPMRFDVLPAQADERCRLRADAG